MGHEVSITRAVRRAVKTKQQGPDSKNLMQSLEDDDSTQVDATKAFYPSNPIGSRGNVCYLGLTPKTRRRRDPEDAKKWTRPRHFILQIPIGSRGNVCYLGLTPKLTLKSK